MEIDFLNRYDFGQIRNVTQTTVLEILQEEMSYLTADSTCQCQQCILDMACYAMCHAPVRYEFSLLRNIHINQYYYEEDVRRIVQQAIERVSLFPNH